VASGQSSAKRKTRRQFLSGSGFSKTFGCELLAYSLIANLVRHNPQHAALMLMMMSMVVSVMMAVGVAETHKL